MLPAVFISLFYREATILSRSDSFGFFKLTMKIRYVGITGSLGDFTSPDVMMKSEHRPALGHPPRSHAYSRILTPGDREPKLAVFEKQLKSCLADAETLRENPSISMAMHSWHSEEGLKTLDLIF